MIDPARGWLCDYSCPDCGHEFSLERLDPRAAQACKRCGSDAAHLVTAGRVQLLPAPAPAPAVFAAAPPKTTS